MTQNKTRTVKYDLAVRFRATKITFSIKITMKRDLIKAPTKIIITIVIALVVIFIGLIIASQFTQSPNSVNQSTEIRLVKITNIQNRGSIFINDTLVINSSSKLLIGAEGYDGWSNRGPIVDYDTIPYIHTLGDLKPPYFLEKEKNSDTIVVKKDGYTLFFKLYPEQK